MFWSIFIAYFCNFCAIIRFIFLLISFYQSNTVLYKFIPHYTQNQKGIMGYKSIFTVMKLSAFLRKEGHCFGQVMLIYLLDQIRDAVKLSLGSDELEQLDLNLLFVAVILRISSVNLSSMT